jgi:glycine cleavage system transcriptional repressor
MQQYIINVFCKDQNGLIANITGALFDLGINLGTTHFALLGEGAKLTAICEADEQITKSDIQDQLLTIDAMDTADISIKPFTHVTKKPANAKISHNIVIDGGDHAGLIARLSEVFIEYNSNIVRMNAEKIQAQPHNLYHIEIAAYIPKDRENACLATLSNTASSLEMEFKVLP